MLTRLASVCAVAALSVAALSVPVLAQGDAANHEERAAAVLEELREAGFEIDRSQLEIEVRETRDCVDDLDRQQGLFFRPTHFRALAALVWSTAPGMERPPSGDVLRQSTLENLSQSLGAYYQFDRKALVFPKTVLAAFNDAVGGRDFMIAHELVHAHQAQREGGLEKILHRNGREVERVRVAQCLLEGEAELVALHLTLHKTGKTLADVSDEDLDRASAMNESVVGGLERIYDVGRHAALDAYRSGGWEALRVLVTERQPASTEQLLHREKIGHDEPSDVTLPDAPEGWELVHDDVYGELQLLQIMQGAFPEEGVVATIGWDGDRQRLFEGPDGGVLFAWRTVWDRDVDAKQFAALLPPEFTRRAGRVVDVLRCTSDAVGEAYRARLPAWTQPAVPGDAESTAAAEAAYTKRREDGQARRDGEQWVVPAAGIRMTLPDGFELRRQGASNLAVLADAAQRFGDGVPFTDNVGVMLLPNPYGLDYPAHLKLNQDQLGNMPGLTLEDLRIGEVAGREALVGRYVGSVQAGAPRMQFRVIVILREKDQVVVTGVSLASRGEAARSLIDGIMDSLKFEE